MDEGLVGEDKIVGLARVGILDRIAHGNYEGAIEILDRLNNNAGQSICSAPFYRYDTYQE